MCNEFGIPFGADEENWTKHAVDLRNNLIHQARWCGSQISTKTTDDAERAPLILHKLNQRLIAAVLEYQNVFVRSGWCTFGSPLFD